MARNRQTISQYLTSIAPNSINSLHENGVLEFWISKAIKDFLSRQLMKQKWSLRQNTEQPTRAGEEKVSRVFELYDIQGIFILWSTGLLLSIVILLGEIFLFLWPKALKRF